MAKRCCVAIGCRAEVDQKSAMCPAHWAKVPKENQDAMLEASRKRDRKAWEAARAEAIASIHPWVNDTAKTLWLAHELATIKGA